MISCYNTKDPSGSTQLSTLLSWASEKINSPSCLLQLCLLRWGLLQAYPPLPRHCRLEFPKTCSQDAFSSLSALFQFSSVAKSCPTLCDPMNRSTSGLPVHHQLLEFTQTHVHWVSDAIRPSHPLSSPSPPAPIPPSIRVFSNESTLRMRWPKYWSFSIIPSKEHRSPLGWTGWISLQSKGLPKLFSSTTVQKHQFFIAQLSSQFSSHIHTWLLEKT